MKLLLRNIGFVCHVVAVGILLQIAYTVFFVPTARDYALSVGGWVVVPAAIGFVLLVATKNRGERQRG
ncbi:hypothetical protein [Burkholderia sp. Tr-20390]|uniref:hypothetical protein n=1 Tax=Burkholderia sp. Tr-20390 TaxID=2703904 RepID=UPI00197D4279|nr:hypothetical protein [Burkholderia sp. Tr-20390]MBN3729501.1 hypothetical protein [Burkholderia sp. Tr-20390]